MTPNIQRPRKYRVLMTERATYAVTVSAPDEEAAQLEAERLWGEHFERFICKRCEIDSVDIEPID